MARGGREAAQSQRSPPEGAAAWLIPVRACCERPSRRAGGCRGAGALGLLRSCGISLLTGYRYKTDASVQKTRPKTCGWLPELVRHFELPFCSWLWSLLLLLAMGVNFKPVVVGKHTSECQNCNSDLPVPGTLARNMQKNVETIGSFFLLETRK